MPGGCWRSRSRRWAYWCRYKAVPKALRDAVSPRFSSMEPLLPLLLGHYRRHLRRRQSTSMPGCLPCEYTHCHSRLIFYTNKPLQAFSSWHHHQSGTIRPPMSKLSSSHPISHPIRPNERETFSKRLQLQTKKQGAKVGRALQLRLRGVLNHNRLWLTRNHFPWTRGLRHSQTQGHLPRAALYRDPPRVNCPARPAFHLTHDHSVAKVSQTVRTSVRPYRRLLLCRYSQKNQRLSRETRRLCHV
jgi:hypothetical protein